MPRRCVLICALLLLLGATGAAGCVRAGFDGSQGAPSGDGAATRDGWRPPELGAPRELSLPPRDHSWPGWDLSWPGWDLAWPGWDTWPGSDLPKGPTHKITGANDTCATAAQVSLKTLPVTLHIDVVGAKMDYQPDCCGSGEPDVVVHLTDVPATMSLECTGGGQFYFRRSSAGCPPQKITCHPKFCNGGGYNKTTSVDPEYDWVICRDPAQGPATLVFNPGP